MDNPQPSFWGRVAEAHAASEEFDAFDVVDSAPSRVEFDALAARMSADAMALVEYCVAHQHALRAAFKAAD